MDVLNQGFFISMVNHAQAHLPALTANCADHRWSVIVVSAVSRSFVGSFAWWVSRIIVKFTFFPRILKHLICLSLLVG